MPLRLLVDPADWRGDINPDQTNGDRSLSRACCKSCATIQTRHDLTGESFHSLWKQLWTENQTIALKNNLPSVLSHFGLLGRSKFADREILEINSRGNHTYLDSACAYLTFENIAQPLEEDPPGVTGLWVLSSVRNHGLAAPGRTLEATRRLFARFIKRP